MAARQAVRVLHREKVMDEAVSRFQRDYLPRLYRWCQEHKHMVQACYLGLPTAYGLNVFVVGATPKFNFELSSQISALSLALEEDGWSSNIVQIAGGDE